MLCPNCGKEVDKERDHFSYGDEITYSCARNPSYHHDTGYRDVSGEERFSVFRCFNCRLRFVPGPEDDTGFRVCPHCGEYTGW
jgi:hypothetical protein